jgi:integrase
MTTNVKLRQKPISGDRQSLYLDFYPAIEHPDTGKQTRREFLGLYIFNKVKTQIEKDHNKQILQLGEKIRQRRDRELNGNEALTALEKRILDEDKKQQEQGNRSFLDYFKQLTNKRKASNHDNWVTALKYLDKFSNGEMKFSDLNKPLCNEFKEYLLTTPSLGSNKTTLSQNSAVSYFNKFKAALKQAYKDGYLKTNLNAQVEPIKPAETHRNYLSLEELNRLVKTDSPNPLLKNAALFSALTGLRFGDIEKLTWDEVQFIEGEGYFLVYTQQKTQGVEVLPISQQAFQLLGERGEPASRVFDGLKYSAYSNKHLYQWLGAAGITKKITFHCFRHTYATMQLSKGTDIYTVSKMLGHRDLKTTAIYTKIVDKTKREAAERIQLDI